MNECRCAWIENCWSFFNGVGGFLSSQPHPIEFGDEAFKTKI
jgi:hypothetical protein